MLKLLMEIEQIIRVKGNQNNFNSLQPIDGIFVSHFNIFRYVKKCHKINRWFCHAQKCVTNVIWNKYHSKLVDRATQKNSDLFIIMTGNCRRFISRCFT